MLESQNNYDKATEELQTLVVKMDEEKKLIDQDTKLALQVLEENKQVLCSRYKGTSVLASPDNIMYYLTTLFPNLKKSKVQRALYDLGFIPRSTIFMLLLIIIGICYFTLYQFLDLHPLFMLCIFFIPVIINTFLYTSSLDSEISTSIHQTKGKKE